MMVTIQAKIDISLEERKACREEIRAIMKVHHVEMVDVFGTDQEVTEVNPAKLEANPEEIKSLRQSMKRSIRNMLQWKLAERQIGGIGTVI
jgi:hypothetical protein